METLLSFLTDLCQCNVPITTGYCGFKNGKPAFLPVPLATGWSLGRRYGTYFTPPVNRHLEKPPWIYLINAFKKNGCLSASDGVILLSGFSARQRSSRSIKWLRSLVSASFIPPDAAVKRVRKSRVGLTMVIVLMFVYANRI
jgi:hypothetical protein